MFILSLQNQQNYQFFIDSVTWNWICSRQFSTLSRPYFSPSEATVNITNWKLSPEMCLNTSKMHLKKLNIFKIQENHDFVYFCRFSVFLKPRVNIFPAILDFGDTFLVHSEAHTNVSNSKLPSEMSLMLPKFIWRDTSTMNLSDLPLSVFRIYRIYHKYSYGFTGFTAVKFSDLPDLPQVLVWIYRIYRCQFFGFTGFTTSTCT